MRSQRHQLLFVLFLPWALSLLLEDSVLLSYGIAWAGSFFIFFMVLSGRITPLPTDRPFMEQLMRPFILVHIIFAGYMCTTSIFYVLNLLGYNNFHSPPPNYLVDINLLTVAAQCQRYYCLGHASFICGILFFMKYPVRIKYKLEGIELSTLIFYAAIISFPLSILFLIVPGLSQFSHQLSSLSILACTLALAFAIPRKKINYTVISFLLYLSNFYSALLSGFKEPIIVSVLILGIFLYPTYKKTVLILFIPLLLGLIAILPIYAAAFRQNAWSDQVSSDEASEIALKATLNNSSEFDNTDWNFLVFRSSEIKMFGDFVRSTPANINYYGFTLFRQAMVAMVPRFFWPTKPSTEDLVMKRVYDAGVINVNSTVSAKPAFIVDAYLSGGNLGIFICLFIYGAVAQIISQRAESLFGGYLLGTALIYSGLFQIFWRGLSFEFIVNSVFWSYISMFLIAKVLRSQNILVPFMNQFN